MTSGSSLVGTLVAYTLARLAIVVAVAGLLVLAGVPLVLAILIGVVAALPLSMLLLRGLRKRMDAGVAAVQERRTAQREVLRARLRGDEVHEEDVRSDDGAECEADAGEHRPGQQ